MPFSDSPWHRLAAVGLLLACGPRAHGAGLAAKRGPEHAAAVAAHQAQLAAAIAHHDTLRQIVSAPFQVAPMLADAVKFAAIAQPGAANGLVLAKGKGHAIEARSDGLWLVPRDGQGIRRPTPDELGAVGMGSHTDFLNKVAKQTVALSGGTARTSVEEAHSVLKQRIAAHEELEQILRAPGTSAMPQLNAFYALFRPTASGGTLVKKNGARQLEYSGGTLYVTEGTQSRHATTADLRDFGINGRKDYLELIERHIYAAAGMTAGRGDLGQAVSEIRLRVQQANQLLLRTTTEQSQALALLGRYHAAVTQARDPSVGHLRIIGTSGKDALVYDPSIRAIYADKPMGAVAASFADYARHEVTDAATLEDVANARLIALARVRTGVTGANALAAAHAALEREIAETEALPSLIADPASVHGAQIQLYRRARMMNMPQDTDAAGIAVPLASTKTERLEIRPMEVVDTLPALGRRPVYNRAVVRDAIAVVDASNPRGRLATVADLHRFEIDEKADLAVAIGDALMSIPGPAAP